jgi:hypothetical protein
MSHASRFLMALGVLGAVALSPACNSALDDPDTADVVLEVVTITAQPIEAQDDGSGCTFTIQDWNAQLRNEPKSELATQSPFGDIRLVRIDATYDWGNDGSVEQTAALPVSGTVQAGGTQAVQFTPIPLEYLAGRDGQSASMGMLWVGETYDGNPVTTWTSRMLVVNSCIVAGP